MKSFYEYLAMGALLPLFVVSRYLIREIASFPRLNLIELSSKRKNDFF